MTYIKPKHPIEVNWDSEEGNDQWVAYLTNYKRGGYFIEGGATPGKNNSASALEREFGWTGLALNANPDHYYHIVMSQNRTNPIHAALWNETGMVDLHYAPLMAQTYEKSPYLHDDEPLLLSYASMVTDAYHMNGDAWADMVVKLPIIKVPSISFPDLLEKYQSPTEIDYIGLDIEGAEFHALSKFPFEKYHVRLWSIENSEPCRALMAKQGYVQVINPYCPKPHEDHYIHVDEYMDYPFK